MDKNILKNKSLFEIFVQLEVLGVFPAVSMIWLYRKWKHRKGVNKNGM